MGRHRGRTIVLPLVDTHSMFPDGVPMLGSRVRRWKPDYPTVGTRQNMSVPLGERREEKRREEKRREEKRREERRDREREREREKTFVGWRNYVF